MNTIGNKFRVSIFGESHGSYVGVSIDGVLPGLPLSPEDFEEDLARRRSGAPGTTARSEKDVPEIVSGLYEGRTTGAPLTLLFRNEDAHPEDYQNLPPRPGHADHTARIKFAGFNDPRGGGAFSGRMTVAVVAAGVVAKKLLHFLRIHAGLTEIGGRTDPAEWPAALAAAQAEGDSLGGVVECQVEGVPAGLGEPFWDSVESCLAHAVFAIPGVRGIEFGDGFAAARMKGSEHNDAFPEEEGGHCCHGDGEGEGGHCCHGDDDHHHCYHGEAGDEHHCCHHGDDPAEGEEGHHCCHGGDETDHCCHHGDGEGHHCCHRHGPQPPLTNHAGGINGGITNGNPLVFRVAFKPTSSIPAAGIPGRHDVCFALRTPVIVEAMAAIVLLDLAL